ncbi:MAG: UDP-N-acetylmuramate--L-alanine ligase [Actinomycetales bacterium]|nr:MAG: UDP-N-acetylmuramate--L-alanine ligase [Actinomycetales bacterium]
MKLPDLNGKRVHFIGLGGAGMSGIARIMLARGISISGSDAKDSSVLAGLRTLGAEVFIGHQTSNLGSADVLVVSSAIDELNPELVAAKKKGISILARAEALALLMSESKSIAVAGTHGKTTTTSMLTVALQQAGLDPSFAIGGMINRGGTNAHQGSGDIFVAEADESDGSFLAYKPFGAIITNIELDHVDYFPDLAAVNLSFLAFVNSIQAGGFLIVGIDSPGAVHLLSQIDRSDIEIITYGESADYSISYLSLQPGESHARITKLGKVIGELSLSIPGQHNIENALAALVAGLKFGAPVVELLKGLASFSGAKRRFENKGSVNGVTVIDDYGHHPTEVRVTLETAKRFIGTGKVIVIFQPHRYSRTAMFVSEFAQVLDIADQVFLLEIYAASETAIPGVSSIQIANAMASSKVKFEPSMIDVVNSAVAMAEPGDLIITLGAGDVNLLVPLILQTLEEKIAK